MGSTHVGVRGRLGSTAALPWCSASAPTSPRSPRSREEVAEVLERAVHAQVRLPLARLLAKGHPDVLAPPRPRPALLRRAALLVGLLLLLLLLEVAASLSLLLLLLDEYLTLISSR